MRTILQNGQKKITNKIDIHNNDYIKFYVKTSLPGLKGSSTKKVKTFRWIEFSCK